MTRRIVSLGDSTSCGEGIGLRLPSEETWPARLTAAVPGARLMPLAIAGSRLRNVQDVQLREAVRSQPDVVTLLVGLNDVARAGFDRQDFQQSLEEVVGALRATGAVVVLGRLHDVTAVLPLPPGLRAAVRARTAAVNASVDACVGEGVLRLDLAALAGLRMRRMWEVDRVHPNAAGHALIAEAAAEVLRSAGQPVRPVRQPAMPLAPGRFREAGWLVRHGLPWLGAHVPQVVLPAVTATVRPLRAG